MIMPQIAPLISALMGAHMPVNNVGTVPLPYIHAPAYSSRHARLLLQVKSTCQRLCDSSLAIPVVIGHFRLRFDHFRQPRWFVAMMKSVITVARDAMTDSTPVLVDGLQGASRAPAQASRIRGIVIKGTWPRIRAGRFRARARQQHRVRG